MSDDKRFSTLRRLWGEVMPDRVRSLIVLCCSMLFAAIGLAGAIVTIGEKVGWPQTFLIIRWSAAILAIFGSLLLHALTIRALWRLINRSQMAEQGLSELAEYAKQGLVRVREQIAAQSDQFDTFIKEESEKQRDLGGKVEGIGEKISEIGEATRQLRQLADLQSTTAPEQRRPP